MNASRSRTVLRPIILIAAAATLMCAITDSRAAPAAKAGGTVQVSVPGGGGFLQQGSSATLPVSIASGTITSASGASTASASVNATFGSIRVSSQGAAVGVQTNVFGGANGYYQDTWTYAAADLTGKTAFVTQTFHVSGILLNPRTQQDTPGAAWGLLITDEDKGGRFVAMIDSTTGPADLAYREGVATYDAADKSAATLVWTHAIVFGQPFSFKVSASAGLNTQFAHDFSAKADYSHTFALSDIGVFYAGNELPANAYTLTTASGHDYLHPVPEPQTVVALVAGLGLAGVLLKRRKISAS